MNLTDTAAKGAEAERLRRQSEDLAQQARNEANDRGRLRSLFAEKLGITIYDGDLVTGTEHGNVRYATLIDDKAVGLRAGKLSESESRREDEDVLIPVVLVPVGGPSALRMMSLVSKMSSRGPRYIASMSGLHRLLAAEDPIVVPYGIAGYSLRVKPGVGLEARRKNDHPDGVSDSWVPVVEPLAEL